MAEHAINAIYLLGEQPDVVCDRIIKHLSARVFEAPKSAPTDSAISAPNPAEEPSMNDDDNMDMDVDDAATVTSATSKPKENANDDMSDMGDAFLLSQLVFIVGHVAIKHIVYLELIERELKRRKDATAKGKIKDIFAVIKC